MNQDYTLAEATGEGLPITLRKFWRLLELTRDMDRNESDADFIRNGGKILYVFDENIFELFIRPQAYLKYARYIELFYADYWRDEIDDVAVADNMREINAQSALITAEYIFSGVLPGQESGSIYMTE